MIRVIPIGWLGLIGNVVPFSSGISSDLCRFVMMESTVLLARIIRKVDSVVCFVKTYPFDNNSSGG